MAHQVKWSKHLLQEFCENALLSDDEVYIMESRTRGVPVSVQAAHLCCSEATVHRMISKIKKKYDLVQRECPDRFPKRKKSAKETWMDEN